MIYDYIILHIWNLGGERHFTRGDYKFYEYAINKAIHHKLCKRTSWSFDEETSCERCRIHLTKKGYKLAKDLEFIENI